jgi:hypothetical protein
MVFSPTLRKGWLGKNNYLPLKESSLHNLPCNMEPNVAFFWGSLVSSIYPNVMSQVSHLYVECKNLMFSNWDFHLEILKVCHKMNNNNQNAQDIGGCNFWKHIREYIIIVCQDMVGASMTKCIHKMGPPFFHKMLKRQLSFKFMIFSLETHSQIPFHVSMWIKHLYRTTHLTTNLTKWNS